MKNYRVHPAHWLTSTYRFNLCVGAPPSWLRPFKVGRWAAERRRAARNALSFGDADDDLDDVEEPWRVFEQP